MTEPLAQQVGILPGIDKESLKAGQGGLWEELWVNGTHMGMVDNGLQVKFVVCRREKGHEEEGIKN